MIRSLKQLACACVCVCVCVCVYFCSHILFIRPHKAFFVLNKSLLPGFGILEISRYNQYRAVETLCDWILSCVGCWNTLLSLRHSISVASIHTIHHSIPEKRKVQYVTQESCLVLGTSACFVNKHDCDDMFVDVRGHFVTPARYDAGKQKVSLCLWSADDVLRCNKDHRNRGITCRIQVYYLGALHVEVCSFSGSPPVPTFI